MESHVPLEKSHIRVPADGVTLDGDLLLADEAPGLVIFAHGSGSSRNSPRNRHVARKLRDSGLGTLLFDLLTPEEEAEDMVRGNKRFDIGLLSRRLIAVTDWLQGKIDVGRTPLGYFGASTGAAAALTAAALRPDPVKAIVSRGGRPDLAMSFLEKVRAPVLLIVGGEDHLVLDLNRKALSRIRSEKKMVIIPGATHLFEEPGALDQVARLAADWLVGKLKFGLGE